MLKLILHVLLGKYHILELISSIVSYLLICRYARCERYSKGVLNCNEAIRLNPNLVRAYLYRGCLKYSIRLYDHAINDLTKALQIDPSCSHAYYNRALCYIRRGNLSYAFKDFAIVLCLASQ